MLSLDQMDERHWRVRSESNPATYYEVTLDGPSLHPRCNCPAGSFGRDCKHVVAVLSTAFDMEESPMTTETAVAVRKAALPSVAERAAGVREALAAALGGINEAMEIAEYQRAMWPDELRQKPAEEGRRAAGLIVYAAAELGVSPLAAFSYITAIKGRPFVMAKMVSALVTSRVPGAYLHYVAEQSGPTKAVIVAHRPGRPDTTVVYTIEMAKQAGLTNNPIYGKFPAAMLRNRAITTAGWLVFADILAGMGGVYDEETGDTAYAAIVEEVPSTAIHLDVEPAVHPPAFIQVTTTAPAEVPDADFDEVVEEEEEESPPLTDKEWTMKVQATLGSLGVEIGKPLNWGVVAELLGLEPGTSKEIAIGAVAWRHERQQEGKSEDVIWDILTTKLRKA